MAWFRAFKNAFRRVWGYIAKNLVAAAAISIGVVLIAAPVLAMPLLNVAGFTAAGIQAGSLAAAAQSAAMGGCGVPAVFSSIAGTMIFVIGGLSAAEGLVKQGAGRG